VPVAVVAAVQQSVPVRLQAIGNVEPYASVAVKSRVDGQILEVQFREGQEVKKGVILFRIDPRPFEAAARQAEAQALRDAASRDQAASQERRYQELLEKNFVSKDAYAQYRTNAQTAQATAKATEAALENAKLNLEYTVIRSPIDGYVGRALLQAGNMVKANDTISLVVINQVKPVYVSFAIPEQQLATVRDLMRKGSLTVEVAAPGSDKTVATGRIAFLDNAVDQTTGTIKVRAMFDNGDAALWPGQFYTVNVKLYDEANAIVVPSRALQTGPDGQFVYVVKADMTAELRKVVVARTEGDVAVLAEGKLAKGERVVVRGALRLAPGIKVNILDSAPAS
jgi:multidrug efflux system membrane fusion protein